MPKQTETRAGEAQSANHKLDEQIEETFPASDAPAFTGGKRFMGAPQKRETPPPDAGGKDAASTAKRK